MRIGRVHREVLLGSEHVYQGARLRTFDVLEGHGVLAVGEQGGNQPLINSLFIPDKTDLACLGVDRGALCLDDFHRLAVELDGLLAVVLFLGNATTVEEQ